MTHDVVTATAVLIKTTIEIIKVESGSASHRYPLIKFNLEYHVGTVELHKYIEVRNADELAKVLKDFPDTQVREFVAAITATGDDQIILGDNLLFLTVMKPMSQSHKDLFTDIYILPNISKLIKNWRDFRCIIVEVSLDRLTRIVDDFIVPNLTNLFRFKRADWESHYGDSYYSVDPIEQITETKEFPRKKEILAKLRIEKNIRETRSAEQMREILDKIAPEDRVLYLSSIPIEKLIRITQNSKDFVYIARQISIEQFVELLAQADRYQNKLIITSDVLVAIDELSVHRPDIKEQVFKLFINNLNDGSIYDEHTARNLAKLMSMLSPELLELFLNKLAYLITEPMCLVQFLSETKSESIADLLTKLHAVLPLMRDSTLIPALKAELQPKAPLVIYDLIKFLESKRESESSVAIDVPGVQPVLIRLRLA